MKIDRTFFVLISNCLGITSVIYCVTGQCCTFSKWQHHNWFLLNYQAKSKLEMYVVFYLSLRAKFAVYKPSIFDGYYGRRME